MDRKEDRPETVENTEDLISAEDVIKGEICKQCGFRCIQGCV